MTVYKMSTKEKIGTAFGWFVGLTALPFLVWAVSTEQMFLAYIMVACSIAFGVATWIGIAWIIMGYIRELFFTESDRDVK